MSDLNSFGSEYCTSVFENEVNDRRTLCYYAKGHEGPHRGFDFAAQKRIDWEDSPLPKEDLDESTDL